MCGIAGFVTVTPHSDADATLRRMTQVIGHRGPDDYDQHAALGHRRLSIIDLATGHQPIPNETRTCWITYNGEVFNHASLRPVLEQAGHHYTTRSDTETILHAYEQYGPDCVTSLRGMFAFAIWNQAERTLFCARDWLGIKPFYYYWDGRVFAFASEIKALLEETVALQLSNTKTPGSGARDWARTRSRPAFARPERTDDVHKAVSRRSV